MKTILFFSLFLSFSVINANASTIISPEALTSVELSSMDVNKIICAGGEIKDVIFSKEKGLIVKVMGSHAFIKFPVFRKDGAPKKDINDAQGGADTNEGMKDGELIYATDPAEIHIVCADSVYSILAVPKRIPTVAITLQNQSKKIKDNLSVFKGMPFEDKLLKILRYVYTEEYPDSFAAEQTSAPEIVFDGLDVTMRKKLRVDGEGVLIYEYLVSLKDNNPDTEKTLKEIDFMPLGSRPVAIAFDSALLKKGEKIRLFIVDSPLQKNEN